MPAAECQASGSEFKLVHSAESRAVGWGMSGTAGGGACTGSILPTHLLLGRSLTWDVLPSAALDSVPSPRMSPDLAPPSHLGFIHHATPPAVSKAAQECSLIPDAGQITKHKRREICIVSNRLLHQRLISHWRNWLTALETDEER